MVTLKQIAEEAGVSVMTVSNVINQNYSKVSRQTVERVNEIIRRRHYVPNLSARSLSGKKSHIITVLVPEGDEPVNILDEPYRQQMIGSVEFQLRQCGYYVMLRSYRTANDVVSLFHNWSVDGAIMFYPPFDTAGMRAVLKAGVPTVVIDRYYDELSPLTVDLDDYRGGYLPARFLIQNGHKKIAFACPFRSPSLVVKDRIRGFADALREAGLEFPACYFFNTSGSYESGIEVGREICRIQDPPTAVVTTLDRLAVGILEGVRISGMSVPDDLSIVGFDDWPVLQYVQPKLTTIAQDFAKKAECVAQLLLGRIEGRELPQTHITLGVELVERQSVRRLAQTGPAAT